MCELAELPHNIDKLVWVGSGIWFSCKNDTDICLVHIETQKIIEKINIVSTIYRNLPSGKESEL